MIWKSFPKKRNNLTREALVALNLTSCIGGIRLKKLLGVFGTPEAVFDAPIEALAKIPGIGMAIAARIKEVSPKQVETEFELAARFGLEIITIADSSYPRLLGEIPDAPILLYVKGDLREGDEAGIAIVGSREASFYGLSVAENFAFELALKGFTVVSGMARGIDTRAHQGALNAKGRTIAVLGSGFNRLYPAENRELSEEIARNGAVVSEFSINEPPKRENFPRRNRIISGLSQAVFVVEAAKNSGALITADFALEQGRDVYALPGKVSSGTSFGTNRLIKEGAKLISSVEDITEELKVSRENLPLGNNKPGRDKLNIAEEESLLYNLIADEPVSFDEIFAKTHMHMAKISSMLLGLQMRKLIKQLPGKQFVRIK